MRNRHAKATVPAALLATLLAAASFPATAADTLGEAFTEGKFGYSFRWRFEDVDQDPFPNNGVAAPLRARINFHTSDLYGLSFKAEFDYVFDFGMDNYNAGGGNTPNPPGYPVIADPAGDDLNQLFLQYKGKAGQFRVGRQRIIYDNARFVGNVGWRQNEQTYDAFSYGYKTKSGFNLQYAYVNNVNRIFGNDVAAGDHEQHTHLFNAAYAFDGFGKLSVYYYDINNKDVAVLSNKTVGFRFAGNKAINDMKLGYGLEFATQEDNADNPVAYDANYWRADVSIGFKPATFYMGYESLGGDDSKPGQAFRTPLATLHAFNGWADKFLGTPGVGLNDAFVGVKGKMGKWNWNVLYHNFSAQSGSGDFGTEWDGVLKRKFKDNYSILFKAALFNTDNPAYGDTNKLWVQLTADF